MKAVLAAFAFYLLTLAIQVHAEEPICQVLLGRRQGEESELVLRMNGVKGGVLRYRMVAPTEAVVTGMYMDDPARGRKLSSALIHGMLLRNPEINKVGALLVMTNLAASGLIWVKQRISQSDCFDAVSKTPFVKSFKHFGFKVSDCYFDPIISFLEVEVSR